MICDVIIINNDNNDDDDDNYNNNGIWYQYVLNHANVSLT